MTLAEARRHLSSRLEEAGVESPEAEALLLLEAATGLPRAELLLSWQRPMAPGCFETLRGWLRRRERREPLQHILGTAPFYGLELEVTPAVLIPRPETERLVELCLQEIRGRKNPRVMDVGTGSGAVALAVKCERPDAVVMATDLSLPALAVARRNAARYRLGVRFVRADLLEREEVRSFARHLDVMVANPPYLPESDRSRVAAEVRYDPEGALYSGPGGLDHFRRLQEQARALLPSRATLLLELDPRNVIIARRESAAWVESKVLDDLTGRPRFLKLRA